MLIWPTGTTPAQRPTWRLLHWGACLPTCRLLICSKQVEFHFDSLELVFSGSHLNTYSSARWKRMAYTFKLNSLFLLFLQFQSLAWTPLCFCVWRRDRKTSWLNLKQMIRGAFFPPFLFVCFYLSPLGGSVASWRSILRSIFCMDTKGMMLHCPFCQRVHCGPWRGLSASHALSNYCTTRLKWSCAVNLNVKVSKQWVCLSQYCPLKQRSANSFLLILRKQLLCSDIWIYF